MTDNQRLLYLKIAAFGLVGFLLLDWVVISPAMASWSEQSTRIDALRQKVQRGQQLIDREDVIRRKWAQMVQANLPTEVSAAENEALQAIGRWARVSGITFASLTPRWQEHDEGYETYECRATATGTQASLSRFVYELETDPIPVNLEEYEITTRDDHGAVLTMTARMTFLRMKLTGKGAL
jgi:Tfp pilus assembly protein PilO